MPAAALVLSLALLASQDPPASHDQTVTCVGVFLLLNAVIAGTLEADPSADAQETAAAAGRLLKAADDDRVLAAQREEVSAEVSQQAVRDWVDLHVRRPDGVMSRELDPCLQRYMAAL
ncbi:hypothetical protein [Brevundimonas sp.]|jgi:hypothetical protein|uniref:hypothetical protein n=1 Tax=Brevundimonas sp. TaxID=1871086 RepID=UPI002E15AAC3|nr:hypothetical protein [Brevundimonas sp.]